MLFSSPDYPIFLIAVFLLYALARQCGWARAAAMVVLGDLVFLLVSKDPGTLWDPLGGVLFRLATEQPIEPTWHWIVGAAVLAGGFALGRTRAGWIGSNRGQGTIAIWIVAILAVIGATVYRSSPSELDDITAAITAHGHLIVLAILGIAIGATQHDAHRRLGRVILLFVASALFYQAWAAGMPGAYRYLLAVLLGTIVLDYYLALWIDRTDEPLARKALVIVSLCSNLGILGFFKYFYFFRLDVLLHLDVKPLHLILPAGISFHTFQSLSYTIDVYRRQLKPTRSVVQFATFVLFFPQLVAGPIVRAQDLLPQLDELPVLELERAKDGVFRIVIGLFKKIALADSLALSIVDRVFESPAHFSALEVLCGVYGYALQIYLDFSAYSDIAIGSAQVLGFELPENFRTPYRSATLQEFWRRWHISLSTWLRDYLYIALGGNRGAPWRTYVNLSLTMLLGGLWHGASWTFIVWGALHGFGLAVTRFLQPRVAKNPWDVVPWCVAIAGVPLVIKAAPNASVWPTLVIACLAVTPLWATLTLLGASEPNEPPPPRRFRVVMTSGPTQRLVESLRLAMCAAALGLFAALQWAEPWTWIPLAGLVWLLAAIADDSDRGGTWGLDLGAALRRGLSIVLVFHYVCLAWIFFRATSFDNALAVLRQIGTFELDHANLVPLVTAPIAIGLICHFFPDGSFRWLRMRFMELSPWAQGALLAAIMFVLRELSHHAIVPFIYFQF